LEYIKTVERQGGVVIITRHGKAAAKLVPMEEKGNSPVFGCGVGSVKELGPIYSTGERWDAD
jgi:antitoxin (DNA-binding transcriptional repressor) of toxin-antitoxin stability system